jgi:hypothetical protein
MADLRKRGFTLVSATEAIDDTPVVSHPNATLTPRTRLRLARLIVEHGWTCAEAAKMFVVAAKTATKWAERYRTEGVAGMTDRSSRPHGSPARTPQAGGAGDRASAVAAPAGSGPDRRPARPARLHGARSAGALPDQPARPHRPGHRRTAAPLRARSSRVTDPCRCHQFGNIPDGGGHRYVGRQQGEINKRSTPGLARAADYKPRTGTAFVRTVIDDHSRVAYAETHADETAATATAALRRAVAWFADGSIP